MRAFPVGVLALALGIEASPAIAAEENALFADQLRPVVSALKQCADRTVFDYLKDPWGAAVAAEQAVLKCTVERVAIRDKAFELLRPMADERYAKYRADRIELSMRMFVIGQISDVADSAIVEAQNR